MINYEYDYEHSQKASKPFINRFRSDNRTPLNNLLSFAINDSCF